MTADKDEPSTFNIANLHLPKNQWLLIGPKNYTTPFEFVEDAFNKQARLEKIITEKEYIRIRQIESDPTTQQLNLVTDLFKLMEN